MNESTAATYTGDGYQCSRCKRVFNEDEYEPGYVPSCDLSDCDETIKEERS